MSSQEKPLKPIKQRGLFITFEGGEGIGKSTQSKLLHKWLQKSNIESILTREPGGTPTSETFRSLLLDKSIKMENFTQLMLHFASRIEHVTDVIAPALSEGKVVICDRFLDSTISYQHYGHGIDKDIILEMHKTFLNNITPDITFLLNLTPQEYIKRNKNRLDASDRYENLDMSYHLKILEGFNAIAQDNSSRVKVIDASKAIEHTHETIKSAVMELIF